MKLLGQIVSLIAMVAMILSYQCKNTRKLYIMQGMGGLMFSVSYFLIGSSLSGLINLFNIIRSVFAYRDKTRTFKYFLIASAFYLIPLAVNYNSWWSYVLVGVQILGTYAIIRLNGDKLRKLQLIVFSPIWLINNTVFAFSIGGIICEIFMITSVLVSYIRYRKSGFIDSIGG